MKALIPAAPRRGVSAAAVLVVVFAALLATTASAAPLVTPTVAAGTENPTCADAGFPASAGYVEHKFDPPVGGSAVVAGNVITIAFRDNGHLVDWTSTQPIDAMIIKGGDAGNVYVYEPTPGNVLADQGLRSPAKGGGVPQISHINVCFKPRAKVEIVKDAQPDAPDDFGFTATSPPGGTAIAPFSLDDDATATVSNTKTLWVTPGTYTVSEDASPGWDLTAIDCDAPSSGDADTRTATIAVASAQDAVTCTFVNVKQPDVDPDDGDPPPVDPPAPAQTPTQVLGASIPAPGPQPIQQTAASRRVSGQARLQGPSGCVNRPFTVRVLGRAISSVAFSIGGRRVRTLQAGDGESAQTLSYRVDTRRLRVGRVSRVSARVTFAAASGTRARTLTLVVQRCRGAIAPRFAG